MDNEKELKLHYEVVCAVIAKDDKIFCCQRGPKGECAYKWEFPGGKIELGETHKEALVREIKEELNCLIKVNKFITTVNHEYNTFSLTMHVYLCELIEGEPILLEHNNSMWCSKDDLNALDFAEADYKFLDKIKKLLDALKDIDELNKALNDRKYFHNNLIKIYNKISNNSDYVIYIEALKIRFKMSGNKHFLVLNYNNKREIFKLFKTSIEMFIEKEVLEEIEKLKDL